MKNNKITTLLLAGFMALVLVSCDDKGGGGSSDDATKSENKITASYNSDKVQLSRGIFAIDIFSYATGSYTIVSSDPDVATQATIDEYKPYKENIFGIKPKKFGNTTITIKHSGDELYNSSETSFLLTVYDQFVS